LSVSGLSSNDGTWAKNADDSWTFKPAANFNGQVNLSYHVTDGNGGDVTASQTLSLAAVNDAPTAVVLSNTVISTSENGGSIKVADIAVTDVDSGTNVLSLSGVDAASFSIVDGADGGKELHFNGGANFETKAGYDIMVNVNDASLGGNPDASQNFHLAITDVNEAPSVALANTLASTAENGGEIKVADIVVSDDALGTNVVSLSGTDAAAFKIVGTELHFIGGADFETQKSYDVTVNVNDASVGGNPDASQNFHLAITDVVEADSDTTNDYDVRDVNGNLQVTSGGATGNGHTFNGSQQADTIVATNDPINGDQVNAKDGGDTLYGRGGNDDLQGQNGNDTIYGGSGDDNITGGNGADHLWGGSGNDKFVFTTADDSLFNAPDTIHDFHHGFDKIDVHSINSGGGGTGDFTFGGTVATAHGVWFTEGGGNTTVHFDTNGNTGNDEMTITLTGTGLGLTASDFIL
ncbi:cadherin-like domain-containing protein, partial [Rhizobium sp. 57MFTsu3.2]|uniref:cadherin-like domain-containing protein n=1 Tax=Rhizobium sp. 57MFTsu3.2 TaxID=1048681 RepID=UPI00146D42FD